MAAGIIFGKLAERTFHIALAGKHQAASRTSMQGKPYRVVKTPQPFCIQAVCSGAGAARKPIAASTEMASNAVKYARVSGVCLRGYQHTVDVGVSPRWVHYGDGWLASA